MKKRLLILAVVLVGLTSCGKKEYFAFDKVVYVHDFPNEYELGKADTLETGLLGILGLKCYGDYMLVSCSNAKSCLATISLGQNLEITNNFLMLGSGPGEVIYRPFVSWMSFYEKSGKQKAGVYDYSGSFLELDISQDSLSNSYRYLSRNLSTKLGSRYFYISPDRFLCRRSRVDGRGFERLVVDSLGRESRLLSMNFLNGISSSEHNLLSSSFAIDKNGEIVAELSSYANAIHLYPLDSLNEISAKTVIFGDKLQNLRDMEKQGIDVTRRTYYDVHPYVNFFAALYVGTTMDDFYEGNCNNPAIHLFSWSGAPIARIQLPVKALLFDIDTKNNAVFVVENDSEKILRYDLPCGSLCEPVN